MPYTIPIEPAGADMQPGAGQVVPAPGLVTPAATIATIHILPHSDSYMLATPPYDMRCELLDNRIIVWDVEDARKLFENGYYGKPIGMPKPKPGEIDAPLVLDLIEGTYLLECKKISVYAGRRKVAADQMAEMCKNEYHDFDKKYPVYKKFRDMGYVVNPGIKFGCDFAVYEKGPGIDHAPYLVQVCKSGEPITTTGLILAGRLATTVRKQFIFAIPRRRDVDFVALEWWKA